MDPRNAGMTNRGTQGYSTHTHFMGVARSQQTASQRGDDMRPNGNHTEEQRQRSQGSSFFNDSTEHGLSLERKRNLVHDMFYVKRPFRSAFTFSLQKA